MSKFEESPSLISMTTTNELNVSSGNKRKPVRKPVRKTFKKAVLTGGCKNGEKRKKARTMNVGMLEEVDVSVEALNHGCSDGDDGDDAYKKYMKSLESLMSRIRSSEPRIVVPRDNIIGS